MNKEIGDRLAASRMLRILVAGIVSLLVDHASNTSAQMETNLYSFGSTANDGTGPVAGLVQGSDGSFYGATGGGGAHNIGTVFWISLTGGYSNLYSFGSITNDGAYPLASLVQGSDGDFYGTTFEGGGGGGFGGTVFRISATGSYSNLYSFRRDNDGAVPQAGLVQGSDGNFYGTTFSGGALAYGGGTVFRISATGNYSNLYSFGSITNDGASPRAALVQGSDGNFYGTATGGGAHNKGTVFRISPTGSYSNLYSFGSITNDGANPDGGLVQGSDGNFYGTTVSGGASGSGTVFRISPTGNYSNLYSFGSITNDGAEPYGGLVQGSDGSFYGMTSEGGAGANCGNYGCGTVFKLIIPLNPPANQISGVQVTGSDMVFSVPSVAGETYQLQFTTDLTSGCWSNISGLSVTNCIGALMTLTNFGGVAGPSGFYRFDITP